MNYSLFIKLISGTNKSWYLQFYALGIFAPDVGGQGDRDVHHSIERSHTDSKISERTANYFIELYQRFVYIFDWLSCGVAIYIEILENDSFVGFFRLKLENSEFGLVGIFSLDERFLVLELSLENRLWIRDSSACTINFNFLNVYWWYDIIFSKIQDSRSSIGKLSFYFLRFWREGHPFLAIPLWLTLSLREFSYFSFGQLSISLLLVTCAFSHLVSIYLSYCLWLSISERKKKKKLETTFRHPAFHFTIIITWYWRKKCPWTCSYEFGNICFYLYRISQIRV